MTTWIRSDEAARVLGVSKPTLYAYVSRGLVERHTAPDGRTSLYARRDVEALAGRARTKAPAERPTIDAHGTSAGRGAAPAAAPRLLALAPTVLGGPRTGDVAGRLTRAWVRRPTDALTAAIG